MANKSIPQLPVLPSEVAATDLLHVVRSGLDYQSAASNVFGITVLTYVQAVALIVANEIIPTHQYYITNMPNDLGGNTQAGGIFVTGLSPALFNTDGIWIRPTDCRAFGYIAFAGGAGSVDQINVSTIAANAGDIMSASVAFNGTLKQTAINVAANINAFGLMRAVAVQNGVVLEALTAGTVANGGVITPTYTTLTTADDFLLSPINYDVAYGQAVLQQELFVKYDLPNNAIIYCEDLENNISFNMPYFIQVGFGGNSINTFRWGDENATGISGQSVFAGCEFETVVWQDFFVYPATGGDFLQNIIYLGQYYQSILINSVFQANQHDGICNMSDSMWVNGYVGRGNFFSWGCTDGIYDSVAINDATFKDVNMSDSTFTNITLVAVTFSDTEDIFQAITWENVIASGSILKGQYDIAVENAVAFQVTPLVVGTPLNLFPIPDNWCAFSQSITKGAALADAGGGTGELQIGTAVDADAIMFSTLIATVNNVVRGTGVGAPTLVNGFIEANAVNEHIMFGSFLSRILGQQMGY